MKHLLIPLLVLDALFFGDCSSLLFYPKPMVQVIPARAGLEHRDVTLTTVDGVRLRAWWLPAKKGVPMKGTVLYLHGNGGNLSWHLGSIRWLSAEGYQVLVFDYRGHGQSEGEPGLPEVHRDIDAAFAWLDQAPEVEDTERVLLGQGLGGAPAVHYLVEHPQRQGRFKALVFDGIPASYRDIARHVLDGSWLAWPLQVLLSWLVSDDDSTIHSVARLSGTPMLFFHSVDDTIVSLENGIALYRQARPPKVLQLTRDGYVQTFAEATWQEVMLHFLDDPHGFTGLRRLVEIPNREFAKPEGNP